MASHREMKRIAESPREIRDLATFLLGLADVDWTSWELQFLEDMQVRQSDEPLSMRQREILIELRDSGQAVSTVRGFSVRSLIRSCRLGSADLDEADADWIAGLHERNLTSIKRRWSGRLVRCARQLGVIDEVVMEYA
jgi:hypothetical protein